MSHSSGRWRACLTALAATALIGSVLAWVPQASQAASVSANEDPGVSQPAEAADPAAASDQLAAKPYMGWSSWSLQSTNYPGVNPTGGGSWINEANVLAQADAMAAKLKPFGYEYINIDAGWQGGFDEYGRPTVFAARFPNGIASVADHVHKLGLKLGIYTVVGIGADAYQEGKMPIFGAEGCFSKDIVYPDLRTTNGWDGALKIDYTSPCAQSYANSIADLFASWGVDFVKMDGVGPGSFKGGPNYDNTEDVKAWGKALKATGRPIQYVISWALSHRQADVWKANTNGWRIDTDVECYCDTIVTWDASVKARWNDVVQWIDDAGPGHWNNLDAVNVGNAEMDGLTKDERQSYMTLWAIESAPLFAGDDLTKLDDYGLSLLTNREVIAIDQAGHPARPVSQASPQQVWYADNKDGSHTVALFNLGSAPATVTANWKDVGIDGPASVRDVWKGANLGVVNDTFSATIPAHGSQLLTITPRKSDGAPTVPTGVRATASNGTSVSLAWNASSAKSADKIGYTVFENGKEIARTDGTNVTVDGLKPSKDYSFTVKAIAKKASADSTILAITTTAAAGPRVFEAEAEGNTYVGNASRSGCANCSGKFKAGNIGKDASFTFTSIDVPVAGNYLMAIGYVSGDASRQAVFTVNGTSSFETNMSGSNDNDWDTPQPLNVIVHLNAGVNTIQVGIPGSYAPNIDQITL